MAYQYITYEKKDKTATITLNTPPLNWLTIVMMREINDALADVKKDARSSFWSSTTRERRRSPAARLSRTTPRTKWTR